MTGRVRAPIAVVMTVAATWLTAGCATSPCDDLDDATAEGGCATHDDDAPEIACEDEAEAYARCWLENVRDVCAPTPSELRAVTDCQGR